MTTSTAPSWQQEYFGPKLLTKAGEVDTATALEGKEFIAIYFSAHWCPPCQRFTPVLAAFYESARQENPNQLEIVFASLDQSTSDFQRYFGQMPWLATPFDAEGIHHGLGAKFDVAGIPTLVVLDGKTGEIKDPSGRTTVTSAGDQVGSAFTNWRTSASTV